MPQSNESLNQTTAELVNLHRAIRPRTRIPGLAAGLLVTLAALACGGADGVAVVEHLPTLTSTPLPTLTPTADATQVAMAADRSQNQDPVQTAPTESEMAVTGIAPGAEPLMPDAAATGPEASSEDAPAPPADPVITNPNVPVPAENPTPTSPPTATGTDIPPTPTETAIPTDTPTPTATPLPQGWVFSGPHGYPAEALNGMVFYGNVMNNTGEPHN